MTADWYTNTLQLLGFELISKYVGENVFANKIQHPVYMVFRRKAVVLTEQKKAWTLDVLKKIILSYLLKFFLYLFQWFQGFSYLS
jgi:hypothetical protein